MTRSSNTRENAVALWAAATATPATASPPVGRTLWMGREAAPPGIAQILSNAGCVLCDRNASHWPPQRVAWLGQVAVTARDDQSLSGRRVATVHPDPGAADALAEALRARGAQVVVLSLGEAGLDRAEALDPEVIVLQPDHLAGPGLEVVECLWRHPRLRWIPVLLVPHSRLGTAGASAPDVRELAIGVNLLCADYELLLRRARRNEPFDAPLEQLGPMRTLRALIDSAGSLRARFETDQVAVEVDLGEGLVIGARGRQGESKDPDGLLGVHAIAALQTQLTGKVSIWPVTHPAVTNIMAPLEAMLLSDHAAPALADTSARLRVTGRVERPAELSARDPGDAPTAERKLLPHLRISAANDNVAPQVALAPATELALPASAISVVAAAVAPAPTAPTPSLPKAVAVATFSVSALTPAPANTALRGRTLPGLAAPPVPRAAQLTPASTARPPVVLAPRTPELEQVAAPRTPATIPNVREAEPILVPWAPTSLAPPRASATASYGALPPARPEQPSSLFSDGIETAPTTGWLAEVELEGLRPTVPRRAIAAGVGLLVALVCGLVLWGQLTRAPANTPAAVPSAPLATQARAPEPIEIVRVAPAEPDSTPDQVASEDDDSSALDAHSANARQASHLVSEGHQQRRRRRYDAARQSYNEALQAYPNYPRALAGLAEVYLAKGDKERSLEAAKTVVRKRPRFADDHRLLGDAYRLNGRMDQALASWRRAATLGSRTARDRLKAYR